MLLAKAAVTLTILAQLDTLSKISWKFQLNPLSRLGGVVVIRFGDGRIYIPTDGRTEGVYRLALLS